MLSLEGPTLKKDYLEEKEDKCFLFLGKTIQFRKQVEFILWSLKWVNR